METREKDYTFAVLTRDELLREKTLLMEKLKDMEEREKRKVNWKNFKLKFEFSFK